MNLDGVIAASCFLLCCAYFGEYIFLCCPCSISFSLYIKTRSNRNKKSL